jgi:hypothetical protein
MAGLLAGGVMKFDLLVVAASLFAGAVALFGCTDSTTTSSSASGCFGPCAGSGGTVGTGPGPAGATLLVRLGTDNLIQSDPPKYKKIWVAIVTDTNGRAVSGVTVVFNLRSGTAFNPGGYAKGFYALPPPPPFLPQLWQQTVTVVCANEDANFDAILDPGEDLNGNGLLEPPGVSDVNPTAVTDGFGFATATVSYPKNYASWAQVTLEATTGGAGATPATATFFLVGLASDYADLGVAPPGDISPFGQSGSCADTL